MADTTDPAAGERRVRAALRTLVDEMMSQIRAASQHEVWTADERARAEADLERIMVQVRREAMAELRNE